MREGKEKGRKDSKNRRDEVNIEEKAYCYSKTFVTNCVVLRRRRVSEACR